MAPLNQRRAALDARSEAVLDAYAAGALVKNIVADFGTSSVSYILNRARRRGDPRAALRRNEPKSAAAVTYGKILDLWSQGVLAKVIVDRIGTTPATVGNAVMAGRRRGDPRAVIRNHPRSMRPGSSPAAGACAAGGQGVQPSLPSAVSAPLGHFHAPDSEGARP